MLKKPLLPLLRKKVYTRLRADDDDDDEGGKGSVPLIVGREKRERFLVPAKLLNHPLMVDLLEIAAHEYGYEQEGTLKGHQRWR
ncbi:auxin-responsive protein SAUR71 [Amborella trichopoda]|uniref:auxin-responsive protein SAUR71 n=1 Tax=Amborella trichopoda TaxID=13333 RepID=UPI0009BF5CED|nr:auxin-responsive protein SAUR71 [Amborella trichopoda]|eukprot:XP_020528554.1 auxin-responsive protein SAUR71 [Amborella trichopoda]